MLIFQLQEVYYCCEFKKEKLMDTFLQWFLQVELMRMSKVQFNNVQIIMNSEKSNQHEQCNLAHLKYYRNRVKTRESNMIFEVFFLLTLNQWSLVNYQPLPTCHKQLLQALLVPRLKLSVCLRLFYQVPYLTNFPV